MILFDLDGTIIDSEQYHLQAYNVILKDYNIYIDEKEFSGYIGQSEFAIHEAIQKKHNAHYDITKAIKDRLDVYKNIIKQNQNHIPNRINELILQKDEYKCVLSSQEESIIYFVFDILGIRNSFDQIISCHKNVKKIDVLSDPYKYIKCDDKQITICEDSVSVLKLAKEKGYKTIGVIHNINKELGVEKYSDEVIDIKS